jgi:hypothetical protein
MDISILLLITSWKRALLRGEGIQHHAPGNGRLPDEGVDVLISGALEEATCHSVRSLTSTIKVSSIQL